MVCILGAHPVHISVVSAHSLFFVGLFNHDDIGKPGGIRYFYDKVVLEKLFHFFSNYFASFISHLPLLLWYRFGSETDGELVTDNVGWIPCIADGYQVNRPKFPCRTSTMCLCSWLVRPLLICIHYLGLSLSCSLTISLIGFRPLSEVLLHGSTSKFSSRLAW